MIVRAGARWGVGAFVLVLSALAGCKGNGNGSEAPPAPASPQAEAVPAPLQNAASPPSSAAPALLALDGGVPPVPLRADVAIDPDIASASPAKEAIGFSMSAAFRAADWPQLAKGGDTSAQAIEAARKKTEPLVAIDFSTTRLRAVLKGDGYPVGRDTEIRARTDRAGHLVIGAKGDTYRPLAPGSLRAFLGEGRFDVAPTVLPRVATIGESQPKLSLKTRRAEVTTRAATLVVDIAHVPDTGEGGVLLCRMLLDLANAQPLTPLCGVDDVPLFAEFRWAGGGLFTFTALSLSKRNDLPPGILLAPPPQAAFAEFAAPRGVHPLLTVPELLAIHTSETRTPSDLALANNTDVLRFVWVDGLPVAWVGPQSRGPLGGLERGKVQVVWRTFLGDSTEPVQNVMIPGASQVPKKSDAP